jgi:hypothetical protein
MPGIPLLMFSTIDARRHADRQPPRTTAPRTCSLMVRN